MTEEVKKMVKVYIMGKPYDVPNGLTIMKAFEYAGYKLIRGCGCRAGFCGACGTVWRKQGDHKIYVGLACQTVVEDGMYLTQIPFFPAPKAIYDIKELKSGPEQILELYPELYRCLGCNSCKRICPQELEVMEIMQLAIRGDIKKAASLSFQCLMCGLCVSRCPAEIAQVNVSLLCRRIHGSKLAPKSQQLEERIGQIESGEFNVELEELKRMAEPEVRRRYQKRDIEK